jgi:SRSO17 transposase
VWPLKVVAGALGDDRRPRHRLILARNRETGATKYFLTNAPKRVGVQRGLADGFVRWNGEHLFRLAKGEVGLTHVEGRSYGSLQRPRALCLVALAFGTLPTLRLRGEKSRGDAGAGLPGPGRPRMTSKVSRTLSSALCDSQRRRFGHGGRPGSVVPLPLLKRR